MSMVRQSTDNVVPFRNPARSNARWPVTIFPEGQHPALQKPTRRKKAREIADAVSARRADQSSDLLHVMDQAIAGLRARRDRTVPQVIPIAMAMDYSTLLDWLEVGRRMIGQGGAA